MTWEDGRDLLICAIFQKHLPETFDFELLHAHETEIVWRRMNEKSYCKKTLDRVKHIMDTMER